MKIILILCISFHLIRTSEIPIIGILSQEAYSVQKYFPNETYQSYIAASYVKYLESAGARVIPISIGQSPEYYADIVNKTNGLFFPGGATWFNQSNGYADAGQILYDLALQANKNGDYYPVWGTCLGMELLVQVAIQGEEIRADCYSKKVNLPLEFIPGFNDSKLFSGASAETIKILSTENVTYNYHQYCVTEQNFTDFGLSSDWRILSFNKDVNNLEFISSLEHKTYPFYGIQFHPEKNQFEFKLTLGFTHTKDSITVSNYFANFFVEETRKNNHNFPTWITEQQTLIYNYPARFIGNQNSSYEQVYVF